MRINSLQRMALVAAAAAMLAAAGPVFAQQSRTLKIQSAVPPSSTTQDGLKFFADRVDKLTGGTLKIEALPGGAVVPPFEILDATHKKVIDGAWGISYWWFGKHKAATLFANTPAGIAGMDQVDFIGWVYDGGGLELWNEFYQKELKLNLVAYPSHPAEPAGARLVQAPDQGPRRLQGHEVPPDRHRGRALLPDGYGGRQHARRRDRACGRARHHRLRGVGRRHRGPAPRTAYGMEVPLCARHA